MLFAWLALTIGGVFLFVACNRLDTNGDIDFTANDESARWGWFIFSLGVVMITLGVVMFIIEAVNLYTR